MKKIKRKSQVTHTCYQCEICKKEHNSQDTAIKCEKTHKCKHEPVFAFIDGSEGTCFLTVEGISSQCKLCGKELEQITFDDIEENQLILKAIFELVKRCDK